MSSTTNPHGAGSPLLGEDYIRSEAASPQDSGSAFQYIQTERQILPKSGAETAEQVLASSPMNPQENPKSYIPIDPQDISLPMAKIFRIMKKAVPAHAMITSNAKEDMERYVVEFIQFLTSEAAENNIKAHRKTIEGSDIIDAMQKTGFEHYAQALRPYLEAYRIERTKKRDKSPPANTEDAGAAAGQDEED